MDFSSPSSGDQFNPDRFKSQLQNKLAQAYAEEFLETLRTKCFDKCITKPGSSLSGGESSCVSRCMDRYVEATGIVVCNMKKQFCSMCGKRVEAESSRARHKLTDWLPLLLTSLSIQSSVSKGDVSTKIRMNRKE